MALAYVVVVGHFTPIHFGSAAVYLFFMLSGYWIDKMWHAEYRKTAHPYLIFLISRIWRLAPIYYLSLGIALVLQRIFHNYPPPTSGWTTVHLYVSYAAILGYASLPLANKILPAVWSLDVELQYYLVAPIVIGALSVTPWRSWQRLSLYVVAGVGFLCYICFFTGSAPLKPQAAGLPMFLIFFLIGGHTARYGWKARSRDAAIGLAVAVSIATFIVAVPATRELLISRRVYGPLADFNPEVNAVIALLLAPYAMATVQKVAITGSWLRNFDRDLGNLSYEVYVLHGHAEVIVTALVGHLSRHERLPFVVLAGVLLLPVSWLVFKYVDRPIDRIRSRWVKNASAAASVAPVLG